MNGHSWCMWSMQEFTWLCVPSDLPENPMLQLEWCDYTYGSTWEVHQYLFHPINSGFEKFPGYKVVSETTVYIFFSLKRWTTICLFTIIFFVIHSKVIGWLWAIVLAPTLLSPLLVSYLCIFTTTGLSMTHQAHERAKVTQYQKYCLPSQMESIESLVSQSNW